MPETRNTIHLTTFFRQNHEAITITDVTTTIENYSIPMPSMHSFVVLLSCSYQVK